MYIGVNGLNFYGERRTFGSLDIMSWGFIYIGYNDLFFLRKRNILFTGCNVVSFKYIGVKGSCFVWRMSNI